LPNFPYLNQQSTGAWIGLFFVVMWTSRSHLKNVFRKIALNASDVDDKTEPFRYRTAFWGLALGMGVITLFCYRAGMSLAIILPFFIIFFALSTAIARVRAELGPPTHELVGMNPGNMMVDIIGTRRIGANNLSIFPLFWFFAGRGYRGHLMPHQLESFKMAEQTRMDSRRLWLAMVIAMIVGSLSAFWALIHLSFRDGLDLIPIGHDSGVFRLLESRLSHLSDGDPGATTFMGIGLAFTFLLMFMRMRFLWWPLHPAGYALSTNFGIDYIWSCLLFSSIIKWCILTYGGMGTHRKAVPFFFGVILGEYCMGSFWSLLSVILQQRTYDFYFA